MSNYEGKLGEWLKYVQQQVEALGKPEEKAEPEETRKPKPQTAPPQEPAERIVMRDRLSRVIPSELESVEETSVIADSSFVEDRPRIVDRRPGVFEDADVPDLEDYLPFLREPERRLGQEPQPKSELPAEWETPSDQGALLLPEGTGEPKPVIRIPEKPEAPEVPAKAEAQPQFARREVAPPPTSDHEVRALWDRLPRHIQLLVGQPPKEVAQRSYKRFKESREELIARLLDPPLSLEEAARILNVCPTTVRRYTNRGMLRHFRTVGNQRRFRLSDVLAFLESAARQVGADGDQPTDASSHLH